MPATLHLLRQATEQKGEGGEDTGPDSETDARRAGESIELHGNARSSRLQEHGQRSQDASHAHVPGSEANPFLRDPRQQSNIIPQPASTLSQRGEEGEVVTQPALQTTGQEQ